MIIVCENSCQVQSDIFFVREELRNIDKQACKFDINLGPCFPLSGREKANLRLKDWLPLIRSEGQENGKGFSGQRGFVGRFSDILDLRQEFFNARK
jgi:hypothetical protein